MWELKQDYSLFFGRAHASIAYDRSVGRVVLYGGGFLTNPRICYSETAEWNGTNWIKTSSNGPAAGIESAMVYDHATASLVLFGGRDACNGDSLSGKTWTREGAQWVETDAAGSPAARHSHAMVYDQIRNEIVLFGGTSGFPASAQDEHHSGSAMAAEVALLQPDFPLSAPTYEASPGCNPGTYVKKNRYISFLPPKPADSAADVALRVTLTQMPGAENCPNVPDFGSSESAQMWVGAESVPNSGVYRLQETPLFRDWAGVEGGVVHVADCNIVPCATFTIEATTVDDYPEGIYSNSLVLSTALAWGDVLGTSSNEPDGIVDFADISACVDSFRDAPSAPQRSRCDVASVNPFQGRNFPIDFADISAVVDAFKGAVYPFAAPTAPFACP